MPHIVPTLLLLEKGVHGRLRLEGQPRNYYHGKNTSRCWCCCGISHEKVVQQTKTIAWLHRPGPKVNHNIGWENVKADTLARVGNQSDRMYVTHSFTAYFTSLGQPSCAYSIVTFFNHKVKSNDLNLMKINICLF